MSNSKSAGKSIIFALLLIIFFAVLSTSASAIGVVPGSRNFVYNQQPVTYEMRIINDENLQGTYDIEITGELTEYVKTSKKTVTFSSNQQQENIMVTLSIPAGTKLTPGDYTVRLLVKEHQYGNQGTMALVGVISKLIITIPGEGAFVQAKILAPNFVRNNTNSFYVEVSNKGNKLAENCFVVVDVYSSLNAKVTSLTSERNTVPPTSMTRILLPWNPTVNNGLYLAKAIVVCDGTSAEDEGSFSIGSPDISIVNFASDNFKLGTISKFDLTLSSNWGEAINGVYADVEVSKDQKSVFRTKTESVDIPALQKAMMPVYIDTTGFAPGDYDVYLSVHYLGEELGKAYKAKMLQDRIVLNSLSGMVIGGGDGSSGTSDTGSGSGSMLTLLIIAVLIIAVVNIVLVAKLLKKK